MRLAAFAAALFATCLAGCVAEPMGDMQARQPVTSGAISPSAAQQMISSYRASNGLPAVVLDPALQRVAQAQARSMAQAGAISHGPQPLTSRLASHGVRARAAAENVAAGYPSLAGVLASWRASSGHNANLLMPEARRMGIALAHAPGSRFGTYWALVITD